MLYERLLANSSLISAPVGDTLGQYPRDFAKPEIDLRKSMKEHRIAP